jgi:hypothetical protein
LFGKDNNVSVIKYILEEELNRLQLLESKYINELDKLPKGSISVKPRNKVEYLYWAFRENDKIKFKYIGKKGSKEALVAIEQKNQRRKYADMINKVQLDIKEIQRSINGKK